MPPGDKNSQPIFFIRVMNKLELAEQHLGQAFNFRHGRCYCTMHFFHISKTA
jgi:hypothetical protein